MEQQINKEKNDWSPISAAIYFQVNVELDKQKI